MDEVRNLIFITLIVLLVQMFSFPVTASQENNMNNVNNSKEVENIINNDGENESEDDGEENGGDIESNENESNESEENDSNQNDSDQEGNLEGDQREDDDATEKEDGDEDAGDNQEGDVDEEEPTNQPPVNRPSIENRPTNANDVTIDLDKEAEPTGNYAEWEVTLSIEADATFKDSDIVLVFDRSNSMYASRLQKAKDAAKAFVDNLLFEGSATRIALVPFGTYADPYTDFQGFEGRTNLKNAIDAIRVTGGNDGGTNIQAGLNSARNLLNNSNAHMKTIVLLSDGAPTYSYRARNAYSDSWPNNKYNFRLHNFNYNQRLGSGSAYDLPTGGWFGVGDERYTVNGHYVTSNGIATISEAHNIIDTGIDIYSVGLEVGSDRDAIYTLENSQNKGYYAGGDDDMGPIFDELSTQISAVASDSYVIDPIGEKFNLVMDGSYNGGHFEPSHGTVTWDDQNETIRWDIGELKLGETYTLTYKVTIDWDENPEGNVLYPTNKPTDLHYVDHEDEDQIKPFPIPEVKIDTGKIVKKGYRVNNDNEPIDSSGNVIGSPAEAEQLYDDLYGEDLYFNQSYDVDANPVLEYVLRVGDDPTVVHLEAANPFVTVWFGYVKETDMIAGDLTVKHVDEQGNLLTSPEVLTGNIGDPYTTDQKDFTGYVFKEMDPQSAPPSGEFKDEEQTVIYIYEKILGSITIIKTDDEGDRLAGATFLLESEDGMVEVEMTTDDSGEIIFEDLDWGEYTVTEVKAPAGYQIKIQPISFTINAEDLNQTVTIINDEISWDIPETGGIGTLGFYGAGIGLVILGFWLIHRKRKSI